jgi:homoserine/homoserine lactone efflux protein
MFLYFLTWTLVALTPGPAVLCSMTQATRHGFRSSLAGIAGIQAGNALFFLCVALGLATLLATATTAFTALRIAGAIYLFYLGTKILLGTFRRRERAVDATAAGPADRRSLFMQGLLIQLTNPKALLFVSALLPQFMDPARTAAPQLLALLAITIAVDTVVLSSYAFCADRSWRSLRGSRVTRWLERAGGTALLFFGTRLLAAKK